MVNGYMHGERVKADIIRAGLILCREGGLGAVTARAIGQAVKLSHAGVLYHFDGGSAAMKQSIAEAAVALGDRVIVPQLIVANHPAAAALTPAQRAAFLAGVG